MFGLAIVGVRRSSVQPGTAGWPGPLPRGGGAAAASRRPMSQQLRTLQALHLGARAVHT